MIDPTHASDNQQPVIPRSPGGTPAHLVELAAALHAERGQRPWSLESSLLGEPAWDLLLALYVAHGRGYSMKVTDACEEARVPPTTSLRWLEVLNKEGYITRHKHPTDMRIQLVRLSDAAIDRMNVHLERSFELFVRVGRFAGR